MKALSKPIPVTVRQFITAIRRLPSDRPRMVPGVWYVTQKQHWLGWLGAYHTEGAYGRDPSKAHDARFAYNHVVNYQMLLWIIRAAKVRPSAVAAARRAAVGAQSLASKSAAIRKQVPWEGLATALWQRPRSNKPPRSRTASRLGTLAYGVTWNKAN